MDYSAEKLENGSSAISDSLTADLETLQQDTNNTKFLEILEREFKLLEEASSHQYILDKFSLESRLKLNKNPKVNELPQIDMSLLLGGAFKQIADEAKKVSINLMVH